MLVVVIDGGAVQKVLGHSKTKNKSNDLEPHFPNSPTASRCQESTKTAVALPHCSENTKDSIAGLEVRLELWWNYGMSYPKNGGRGASNRRFVRTIGFFVLFCRRCNTGHVFAPLIVGGTREYDIRGHCSLEPIRVLC